MARKRDPRRDEAFQIWRSEKGEITNRALAEKLNVSEKTLSGWKSKDNWNDKANGVLQSTKRSTPKRKAEPEPVVESEDMTDKQRLFCIYYIKYFNATKAYRKAYQCSYEVAMRSGSRLMKNVEITQEIDRLKAEQMTDLKLDVRDVLQKYIDIAFADITDFARFGQKEIEVFTEAGEKKQIEVNYVDFHDWQEVDGTIITEVKQGKDGISVKLADKMRALEQLSKYFDMLSDNDKKRLQEEKLKVDIAKTAAEVENLTSENASHGGDDWVDALRKVAEKRKVTSRE